MRPQSYTLAAVRDEVATSSVIIHRSKDRQETCMVVKAKLTGPNEAGVQQ